MGRFAMVRCKRTGRKRWKYAGNAKCSELCCLFKMWSQGWTPFLISV